NMTPTELARHTGLSSGSTTAMLDRLEKKNFIQRTPHPTDRRGVLISINEDHAKMALPLVSGIQKAHRELIASHSEENLTIITDFLNKMAENLIEHTKI